MQNSDYICELVESETSLRDGSAISIGRRSMASPLDDAVGSRSGRKAQSSPGSEQPHIFNAKLHSSLDGLHPHAALPMTMAKFVEQKFIPEFVMTKGLAGRTHFRAILKHVLPPEVVAICFGKDPSDGKNKLTTVPGWPYLDGLLLSEITEESIRLLTARALEQGYSVQTATHIRNVIRSIFNHAIRTGCYAGRNPAAQVSLPVPARGKGHVLTLQQLAQLTAAMGYPEKEMTLFALMTGMNVAEICGLNWKYLNLSNTARVIGSEVIPPRTIAVRSQSHRGKVGEVSESRKRFVRVPSALQRCLAKLRRREDFVGPHDFVLVSRNGTPLHPENVAARRLKLVGESMGLPWLTWTAFYRTRLHLTKQFGPHLQAEFEKVFGSE